MTNLKVEEMSIESLSVEIKIIEDMNIGWFQKRNLKKELIKKFKLCNIEYEKMRLREVESTNKSIQEELNKKRQKDDINNELLNSVSYLTAYDSRDIFSRSVHMTAKKINYILVSLANHSEDFEKEIDNLNVDKITKEISHRIAFISVLFGNFGKYSGFEIEYNKAINETLSLYKKIISNEKCVEILAQNSIE